MSAQSRILIVDDDPDIRKVLRLLLKENYIVAEAADGTAARVDLAALADTR